MPTLRPALVVVTGPAGAGKTTLAHLLAAALDWPAICRDEIKEHLVDRLEGRGEAYDAAACDRLTREASSAFFLTLGQRLRQGQSIVAEAAFQNGPWRSNLEPVSALAEIRIIRCHADPTTARRRVEKRPGRRAHADSTLLNDGGYYDRFVPLALPVPTLDVRTTRGYDPTFDEVVAFARGGQGKIGRVEGESTRR